MSTIEFGYLVSNPGGQVRWGGGAGRHRGPHALQEACGQTWWGRVVLVPSLLMGLWGGFPPQEYAQSRFQFYFQQKGQLSSLHPSS